MDGVKAREELERISSDITDIIIGTRGGSVPSERDIWNLIPRVL